MSINVLEKNGYLLYIYSHCLSISMILSLIPIPILYTQLWEIELCQPHFFASGCVRLCHKGVVEEGCKAGRGKALGSFLLLPVASVDHPPTRSPPPTPRPDPPPPATFLLLEAAIHCSSNCIHFLRFLNPHRFSLTMPPQRPQHQLPMPPLQRSEFQLCEAS